ncbi:MAG: alpha/beta fold hydrolase [Actinobacteria bacterium]|nr:alpha/beta fold hydrolase [Actinomycetota bacterium]
MPSLPPAINLQSTALGDEGRLVIALHDVGRSAEDLLEALRPLADERHRVVSAWLRGHGTSPTPQGPWSIDDFASDVARLLAAEGGPATLVGVGLGAATALALTLGHPGMVSGLVISGLAARGEDADGRDRWMLVARGLRDRGGLEGIALASEAMATRPDWRGALAQVDVPVVVVAGSDDRAASPSSQREFAMWLRGTRVEVVDGAGHDIVSDRPRALVDAVRWLAAGGRVAVA